MYPHLCPDRRGNRKARRHAFASRRSGGATDSPYNRAAPCGAGARAHDCFGTDRCWAHLIDAGGDSRHQRFGASVKNGMKQMARTVRTAEAGYTLMELLVVLAILGLLAAIATPMVLRYLDSAKVSTAKTEISNLEGALDLFKYDVGRYPTTQEGLAALTAQPTGSENWNGPYVKKSKAAEDPWGHPYQYRSPGQHGEYDIYSLGPKGQDSAEKPAIANW